MDTYDFPACLHERRATPIWFVGIRLTNLNLRIHIKAYSGIRGTNQSSRAEKTTLVSSCVIKILSLSMSTSQSQMQAPIFYVWRNRTIVILNFKYFQNEDTYPHLFILRSYKCAFINETKIPINKFRQLLDTPLHLHSNSYQDY